MPYVVTMFHFIESTVREQGAHHTSIEALWETKWEKRVSSGPSTKPGNVGHLNICCRSYIVFIPFGKANQRTLKTSSKNS